jgi:hypothetical protein
MIIKLSVGLEYLYLIDVEVEEREEYLDETYLDNEI